jgi:two-component system NarL family response regulator
MKTVCMTSEIESIQPRNRTVRIDPLKATIDNVARIRILIVDNHPAVREGLTTIVNSQPDMQTVAVAEDGVSALDQFRIHRPDITLTDLQLPRMHGVEVISTIINEFPSSRIIVLTASDGDEDIFRAFQARVRGYLLKSMTIESYLKAIRAVHAGKRWVPDFVAGRLTDRMNRPNLTQREYDVIKLIIQGRSNKEISSALSVTEETVKSHIQGLFAKLGVNDRTKAAITALRQGIVHL